MRIAIYHNLPSGGAKRSLYEAVSRLSSRHSFDVYTLSTADHNFGDLRPFVEQFNIYPFEASKMLNSPFGRLNMLIRRADLNRIQQLEQKIASDISKQDYDLIFVSPCQFEIGPSILRLTNQIQKLYFCHEPPRVLYEEAPSRPYTIKSKRRKAIDKLDPLPNLYFHQLKENDLKNFSAASMVLVNSNFMKQTVENIYQQDVSVCYLGADTEFFCPLNHEKQTYLLSVGSLTPLKNFDFLIQSLAYIPKNIRPQLMIASNFQNPHEREYLENLATQLQVDLELLGNIDDEKLRLLYNQAKLTVYAPIREPFGLVPIESMACGTPVVAVREGGMQETIIDGQTGYLVDRNPEVFSKAIMELYENQNLANQMGAAGREHVSQNWSWSEASERVDSFLTAAAQQN